MTEPSDRRLGAILFTDIVGYTALMAADEERGLRARERHRELVEPLVAAHRGEPVEMRGDECLMVFPSGLEAVRCALGILDAVAAEPDLDLHLGIHVGDIIRVGSEISGDGVNLARRLCALTEGGGLCVSSEVREAVRNQPGVEAVSLGLRELKGIGRPVDVFALGRPGRVRPQSLSAGPGGRRPWAGIAAACVLLIAAGLVAHWWGDATQSARDPIRSIGVLPLENLTGDPSQAYFVEGMTEALIMGVARIGSLRVTSRTTMLRYAGTQLSLPEIAAELDVEALIEGSILLAGDRVRISVQLVDARNDRNLWAENFDRDLGDVLGLQSEVARKVAKQVEARLTRREEERLTESAPVDPAAQDAYLKGIYFANKHTPPAALRARGYFEEAMRLDPAYPLGYAGLADTLSCSPMHTWVIAGEGDDARPVAVMDRAWDLARRAIDLDPNLPEAQTALGLVHLFRNWDWQSAMNSLDTAVEISPSYEFARRGRAHTQAYQGRLEDAKRDIDHALVVDPLNAQVTHMAGQVYEWNGNAARASELYREATALDAGNPNGRHSLGLLRCKQGASEEGATLLEEALRISQGDPLIVGDLGWCLATGGHEEKARAVLRELRERSASEWVSPIAPALVHIGLEEREEALAQLERAYEQRAYRIVTLDVETRWDPIRADATFQELRRKVGLPPSGMGTAL